MTTIYARRLALSTAILAACAAGAALAEDPHTLADCSAISNTAERLACYDRLAGRAPASKAPSSPATATPAAPVSAAPAAATPAPTAAASEKDFGLSKVQKERANGAANSPAEMKSLTAQVTGFRKGPSGRPRVILDNGQTWEYEEDGDALLAIGDSITIRRASLGSFLLVTPAKRVHRVRRIR